jgi:hypothetical protein
MPRGPCTFKQRDVTRALKAAVAAGIRVERIEIDREGKIVISAPSATPVSAYDAWKGA